MQIGNNIIYRIKGKINWKRGIIKSFPANGLIEIGVPIFDQIYAHTLLIYKMDELDIALDQPVNNGE